MAISSPRSIAQWDAIFPIKSCGADSSLYSATFAEGDLAFAVGEDGAAFRSTDGGARFTRMPLGTNVDLYGIRFLSARTGWMCGDSGFVAYTNDAGDSWTTSRLPNFTSRACYAMEWIDGSVGYVCGGSAAIAHGQLAVPDGFILRTTDAGKTWDVVHQDVTKFFWSISIKKNPSGAAIPYVSAYGPFTRGEILFSTNKGATWTAAASNLQFLPHGFAMLPQLSIAVGGNPTDLNAAPSVVYSSNDAAWTVLPDTISARGFAWSVDAFITDSSRSDNSLGWKIVIGLNDGTSLRAAGRAVPGHSSTSIRSIDPGEKISPCAVYDFASRRTVSNDGTRWNATILAVGSGRGLFRRSESGTALRVERAPDGSNHFRIDHLFPNPVSASRNRRVTVSVANIQSLSPPDELHILVFDRLGRERLRLRSPVESRIEIPIDRLEPDFYHVAIHSDRVRATYSLMILP